MQQSNLYILVFSICLTVILGVILSVTAVGLKPIQQVQIELEKRKQILGAVMELKGDEDVLALYKARTKSMVVNVKGEVVENDASGNPLIAENMNIAKEFKKDPADRLYPVFKLMNETQTDLVEAYILPMYGNGLWNNIWAYVALDTDLNTVMGVSFDHTGETPGLGARITEKSLQNRYVGKKIFDSSGALVSIVMQKGEKNDPSLFDDHQVDGMSGATLTAKGVNAMFVDYLGSYQGFISSLKAN